jgi:acyl carrier protein
MRQTTVDRPTFDQVKAVLRDALQLGPRADRLTRATQLLGSLPELDSMAVVTVITALEERFGITVEDDEISAETFATVGALADFVESKLSA